MNLLKLLLILLIPFHSVGQNIAPKTEIVKLPLINEISEESIGNSLIEDYKRKVYDGFTLTETLSSKWAGSKWVMPPTDLFLKMKDKKWSYYLCIDDCIDWQDNLIKGTTSKRKGGIKMSNKGNKFALFQTDSNGMMLIGSAKLENMPNTTPKKVTLVESSSSFKTEFIYNGKIDNSVKFIYREFIDDMARPAFNQEVQYDLNEEKVVGFRDLKIEIIEATNSKVKYKILKHL